MVHKARTESMVTTAGLFVPLVADDTEEAPWMVRGDRQFWAASILANTLDAYAQLHRRPWYVASMLPILYRRPGERRTRQVAPDLFVAFVPRHPRESYDLAREGVFPAFVLEVLSPSSTLRDSDDKRALYEALGAREYVLFAPDPALQTPPLQGYRRGAQGRFDALQPDEQGRLWSETLQLWLAPEGALVRAVQANGQPLLTQMESETARLQAEGELARLRAMLEQHGQQP